MTLEEKIKEMEKEANQDGMVLEMTKSISEGAYYICIAEQKLAKKALSIIQELRNSDKIEEVAKEEVWEEVGNILNIVRCNEKDLKNLNEEYEDFQKQIEELESEISYLKSDNKDLLEQIKDLTN
jgi:chaperonin cofactor prefoldin